MFAQEVEAFQQSEKLVDFERNLRKKTKKTTTTTTKNTKQNKKQQQWYLISAHDIEDEKHPLCL